MTDYTIVTLQLVLLATPFLALLTILASIVTAIGLYTLYWLSGKLLDACWWVQDKAIEFRESVKVWQ